MQQPPAQVVKRPERVDKWYDKLPSWLLSQEQRAEQRLRKMDEMTNGAESSEEKNAGEKGEALGVVHKRFDSLLQEWDKNFSEETFLKLKRTMAQYEALGGDTKELDARMSEVQKRYHLADGKDDTVAQIIRQEELNQETEISRPI